ncbi:unnamed protein product [Ranitomeya imitator]|uniref:EGF-like domain-containing protein n=1 Tax=Ranitomeya imitator TaxID=111125 RepID=A0ABN9M7G8_9NEOB|nr:unnamed protein product [Ranitomeya imitator]
METSADDCENGASCDPVTGVCRCPAGFNGDRCEKGCNSGTFGENCGKICECEGDGPCDPVTGVCFCPPGKTGATCDLDCRINHYGPNCSLSCDCGWNAQCNALTGGCICLNRYVGATCQEGGPPPLMSAHLQALLHAHPRPSHRSSARHLIHSSKHRP